MRRLIYQGDISLFLNILSTLFLLLILLFTKKRNLHISVRNLLRTLIYKLEIEPLDVQQIRHLSRNTSDSLDVITKALRPQPPQSSLPPHRGNTWRSPYIIWWEIFCSLIWVRLRLIFYFPVQMRLQPLPAESNFLVANMKIFIDQSLNGKGISWKWKGSVVN